MIMSVPDPSHSMSTLRGAAIGELPFELPRTFFAIQLEQNLRAITDTGRAIPLFRFEAFVIPVVGQQLPFHPERNGQYFLGMAERKFLTNTKQDPAKIVRLIEPHTACNCHGWVFAGGKFGIEDSHVSTILADNGYVPVKDARDGDIAIYENGERITHSGFVRPGSGNVGTLIESKWGPFGVFLHAPESHPFPGACSFYRSSRNGHTLALKRTDVSGA
jgi:hypothetical protein